MRVEVLVEGMLDDLHDWAAARAEQLGCTYADVVNRALEAERRRVEKLPRLDPRTVRVGGRGAGVQMGAGEYTIGQLEEFTGTDHRSIGRLAAKGFIRSGRPTAPGVVAAYGDVDAVILLACAHLRRMGLNLYSAGPGFTAGLREVWPRVEGMFVVATCDATVLVTEGLIAATAKRNTAVYVVSVQAVMAELGERRRAA